MELKDKKELCNILILAVFFFFFFFLFLGSYPLIDVDETRYVRIAQEMLNSHNFLTPVINGELFLEKPPLFFWLEDLSFMIFGVNEWSARIPMGLVASFGVFMMYYFGKKNVNSRFGLISALILGSSVIYVILSHIAILDLLLSVTMMISTYFGIMTLYSQGRSNNLYWCGFYVFSALSVMSKGLPGIIMPFAIVFLAYFFSKKLKELLDYKKIGIGILLMLIIILPWHLMMCKVHGQAFVDEYIIKHHIARFFNSAGINRKEPCWFYIPVLFIGFIPFVFTLITVLGNEIRKIFVNFKNGFNFDIFKYFSPDMPVSKRFLSINILAFLTIFIFFSISSTKLPTYVLPAAFPLAFITGYIFEEYLENNKFALQIKISNIIAVLLSLMVASLAVILLRLINYFPYIDIINVNTIIFLFSLLVLFFAYSFYNILIIKKDESQKYFFRANIILMVLITMISNVFIYNQIVAFGQDELIAFSKYARNNELKLATFDFGHRYSTIFYYGNHVEINETPDYKWLEEKLNEGYVVILKNKNVIKMPAEYKFDIVQKGKKYTLVKKFQEDNGKY